MSKTKKKPASRKAAPSAEPKGTALVSIHPNVINVQAPGREPVETPITNDNAADIAATVCAELRTAGYAVKVERYDSNGRKVA